MRRFEAVSEEMRKVTPKGEEVVLPLRGTKSSCGYDFFATEDMSIKPGEKYLMWTDVKCHMEKGEFLMLDVRSSAGTKLDLMLGNTLGLVDGDYCDNLDNEGNIGICLRNLKPAIQIRGYAFAELPMFVRGEGEDMTLVSAQDEGAEKKLMEFPVPIVDNLVEVNTVHIKKGERVCQGVVVKFQEVENCNSKEDRTGGFGSTGVK